jgi:hypothetical protein
MPEAIEAAMPAAQVSCGALKPSTQPQAMAEATGPTTLVL